MKVKHIFLLAAFTYLLLAPFYFHPDLKIIYSLSKHLSSGVFNIYSYTALHPSSSGPFVYPPLTYLIFGLLFPIVNLFAGLGFRSWLAMGNTAVDVSGIHTFLFLTKLPLILLHILTGLLVSKAVRPKNKILLLALWFFNPISIYVTVLMGQIDILPVLLTVASLVVSPVWAVILLGLGGSFKAYPLLLLPLWLKKPKLFILGVGTYLVTLLPFVTTPAFFQDTLLSGLSQRLFQLSLSIGFDQAILLIPGALIMVWLYAFKSTQKPATFYLPIILLVLLGIRFNPQWALWAVPFISLYLVNTRNWLPGALFLLGWFGSLILSSDPFLTWGIFSPFDPGLLLLPPISSLIDKHILTLLLNCSNTILAAASLWMVLDRKAEYEV